MTETILQSRDQNRYHSNVCCRKKSWDIRLSFTNKEGERTQTVQPVI